MKKAAPTQDATVARLGARGDAIVEATGGPFFVAGALPGERIRLRPGRPRGDGREAALVELLEPSPDRIAPPCRHFGACGGCAVQHLAPGPYRAWKRDMILDALRRRGFDDAPVAEVTSAPPGARRRARFALLPGREGPRPAFRAARSHDLVAPRDCPVIAPGLLAAATGLARALDPRGVEEIEVTVTDAGIDAMAIARRPPGPDESADLAAAAAELDLARIAWREGGRPAYAVAERRTPTLTAGGVAVALPPGAFVQPTAWGEAAIVAALAAILPPGGRLADLYAGCGLLGLALAQGRTVAAFEAVPAMAAAAQRAADTSGIAGYGARVRDLEERPLDAAALARFEAVLLDPPRGGARAQCEQLAASAVPLVAYVSCHPGSFARDARFLADGGYELVSLVPLDQFLWSHHLELVAHFTRR